ncbi:MAG: hypothetical protein H6765_03185 [Candidatus Peribacteria bacterium]|nr:MAG: hypothetical protein H6765_03185 [Candidatus Peribacteria bacterium]
MKDIIRGLKTQEIRRLRLGVGRPAHPAHPVVDYVLGKMSEQELAYWSSHKREIEEKIMEYMKNTG